MARAKRGFKLRRRHKKVLKLAKGFRGTRSKLYRVAIQIVRRSLEYAYRDRRVKKREFRSLWVQRINAASRLHGVPYGRFMDGLKRAHIAVDRRQMADLAVRDPEAFGLLVKVAKAALAP